MQVPYYTTNGFSEPKVHLQLKKTLYIFIFVENNCSEKKKWQVGLK
jgi:hypothetical protein